MLSGDGWTEEKGFCSWEVNFFVRRVEEHEDMAKRILSIAWGDGAGLYCICIVDLDDDGGWMAFCKVFDVRSRLNH